MNSERLYDIFTEALKNEAVKAELMRSLSAAFPSADEHFPEDAALQENAALKDAVSRLTDEKAALEKKLALLEYETGRLECDRNALLVKNREYSDTLRIYTDSFSQQAALYEKYRRLSPSTARVMSGFFKNSSLAGIFMCGILPENLSGFRDYTESLVINGYDEKKNDIAILDELYIYLLSCYNSTFASPVYSMTAVSAGDAFDERIHHNVGTAKSGRISDVLLQGCISTANSKVIRKAIVRI